MKPANGWQALGRTGNPMRVASLVLAGLAILLVCPEHPQGSLRAHARAAQQPAAPQDPAQDPANLGQVEVVFSDGSQLKLTLRQERIDVQTPYGKLTIPLADVHRIEFGLRIPEEIARQADAAIANLESEKYPIREAADRDLLKLGPKVYPALLKAAKHKDPEVARRAEKLVDKLREQFGDGQLDLPDHDVIHAKDCRFTGRIEGSATWRAHTAQFGDVQLKLADIRTLRFIGRDGDVVAGNVITDPGSLVGVHQQVGKTFAIRVTGTQTGQVWGSDSYTADSTLAAAAVHAGLVRPGQTGVVRVSILGVLPTFQGSTRNGVTSSPYGACPAFKFLK